MKPHQKLQAVCRQTHPSLAQWVVRAGRYDGYSGEDHDFPTFSFRATSRGTSLRFRWQRHLSHRTASSHLFLVASRKTTLPVAMSVDTDSSLPEKHMIWLFIALVLIAIAFKIASLMAAASLWALCAKASFLVALIAFGIWSVRRLGRRGG